MTPFDDSTESDNESEYFDASEYLENKDDSDSDDEFHDARDSFNDSADSIKEELPQLNNNKKQEAPKQLVEKDDPLPSAAAPSSVLSEKRKFDNVAQDDQDTDSNSPVASSSPCCASVNQPKKLKTVIKFGQTSGFGAVKVPQAVSSIKATAPTVGLFKTAKPFSFSATMHDANTVVNVASTSSLDDDNKENDDRNSTLGQIPREILAGAEEIEVTTGEEKETTICQTRGKLYVLDNAQNWKERGLGTFRLNKNKNKNNNESRLIMRTDSVHRLILNQKLFPGMSVSIAQDKFIIFAVFETVTNEEGKTETKMVNHALKLGSAATAEEVCKRITSCIPPAPAPKRKLDELSEDDDDDEQPPSPKAQVDRQLSPKKQRN